jgi:hypothetical protein
MKKAAVLAIVIVLAAAWGARFYFVNSNAQKSITQVFEKGTEVPVGRDFFDRSDEDMDGYTVTILDAELIPTRDYLDSIGASEQSEILGTFTDYIYAVCVSIANIDNPYTDQKGIALERYYLQGVDYTLSLERACFQLANPTMPGTSFSLKQGTSKEIILPFEVMSEFISLARLSSSPPRLQISQYPTQKLLELH